MPLSYEQAKDQIAKEEGYSSFDLMIYDDKINRSSLVELSRRAAELYADSVARDAWDRACEVQRKRTYEVLGLSSKSFLYPRDYDKLVEWMESGAKPEYQPK